MLENSPEELNKAHLIWLNFDNWCEIFFSNVFEKLINSVRSQVHLLTCRCIIYVVQNKVYHEGSIEAALRPKMVGQNPP